MDKNQFIGLILMLVLITVYFQFFAPNPLEEIPDVDNAPFQIGDEAADPAEAISGTSELTEANTSDSAKIALWTIKYGQFWEAAEGTSEIITVENEDLKIDFSSKGGLIQQVELKNFESYGGTPLILFNNQHKLNFYVDHQGRRVDISELHFTPTLKKLADTILLDFSLNSSVAQLDFKYKIGPSGFLVDFEIVSNGFEKVIDAKNPTLFWGASLAKLERELEDTRRRTSVVYYYKKGEGDNLSKTATSHEEDALTEPLHWVSFNQKFFTSAVIAKKSFSNAFVTQDIPADDQVVKNVSATLEIPYTDLANSQTSFSFYFGPNDYQVLKAVTEGFENNLELGWFFLPAINKFLIIPIFNFLEMFLPNYGLIIIVMVLIIRVILSPLTYKSHISMAKMRVLKPELDELKEEIGDDMQKQQTAQMDLYRKAGINPLSGCIPVLLQFPILVSLFYFIPNAIELRLVPFLWAEDMSSFDSILDLPFSIPFYGSHVSLFTLLMAGSTVLTTMVNAQTTSVQGPMKSIQYMMPVMLLFFFNSYPSGLSYYYFVSNIVSFGQIALFRRFVDEDKIHRIMQENKKKNANKKKSKFQSRLEEAMKASQEAQKKNKKK
ncbi:MAG: membrane protein insertase YidC [Cyclobacteriaceae bacterium]